MTSCVTQSLTRNSKIVCQCERDREMPRLGEDRRDQLMRGVTPPDGSYVGPSSCNKFTDLLGSGQKVLSYSYYTPGVTFQTDRKVGCE